MQAPSILPTTPTTTISPSEQAQGIVLRDFSWNSFLKLLRLFRERRDPRPIYLAGDLYLVSPYRYDHEQLAERINLFFMTILLELATPCRAMGQTTFLHGAKRVGIQGDKTYYIGNIEAVQGKGMIDLTVDPPPDLAIEVVMTHPADEAVKTWRKLGVAEIWVASRSEFRILVRREDGKYTKSSTSRVFPFLTAVEIQAITNQPTQFDDTQWLLGLRNWVREVLIPRLQQGA